MSSIAEAVSRTYTVWHAVGPAATHISTRGGHGFRMFTTAQRARHGPMPHSSTRQRAADELVQEQVALAIAIRLHRRRDIQAHELGCVARVCRLPLRYVRAVRIAVPDEVGVILLH